MVIILDLMVVSYCKKTEVMYCQEIHEVHCVFFIQHVEKTSIQHRLIEGTFVWYTIRDRMVVRDNLHRRPLTS